MPHSYLGRTDFKTYQGDTTTAHDVAYRLVLEAVSRQLDDWLGRTFRTYLATNYFTAEDPYELLLDDVLAITAVHTDQAANRTYNTTLATSDWEYEPPNATAEHKPFTGISIRPNATHRLITSRRGVRIAGTWGYWQDLISSTATATVALNATSTSFLLSGSTSLQPGQTVLIDTEQIYINDLDTSSNALVERGVNGTTATTHSSAPTLQVYRYPAPIVEATRIQASRLYKRKDAPLGSFAGPTDMLENVVVAVRLDPDAEQLIATYRRFGWLAV